MFKFDLKKYISIFMFLAGVFYFVPAAQAKEPLPHPIDKASHALGGALLDYGCKNYTNLPAPVCTFVIPAMAGVLWELKDQNFDKVDAVSWSAGGIWFHWKLEF